MKDNCDITLKILVVGDSCVGKTNFVNKFLGKQFNDNYMSTAGLDLKTGKIELKNKKIRIQIWDTAGQEKYKAITRNLFLKVMGAIIIYDITNKNTFYNLKNWISLIKEECDKNMKILIIGNKSDLDSQREISREDASNYAKMEKVQYIETSSKTGENVIKAVTILSEKILENNVQRNSSIILDASISFSDKKSKKNCC